MLTEAIISRIQTKLGNLVPAAIRLSGIQSLAVDQIAPEGMDLTRAGRRFMGGAGGAGTAVGQAPVATIPTTAAQFCIWNGEADNGKSYVLDWLTIAQLSGTAAVGSAILVGLTTTKVASIAMGTGYGIVSASRGGPASKATMAVAQTLTVNTWIALKANGNPATTTNGGDTIDVKGKIIIPPGYALGISVLSGAGTTPLNLCWAGWAEVELDLE